MVDETTCGQRAFCYRRDESPTRHGVVGQALLEGLFIRRAVNPELVSDQLIIAAMELLAGFVDDGDGEDR